MSRRQSGKAKPGEVAGFLAEIIRNIKLVWRLLWDPRVPTWVKMIPLGTLVYLLFPVDLIADPVLGLGQLDDVAVALLGMKLFIYLCPQDVVAEHLRQLSAVRGEYRAVDNPDALSEGSAPVVDADYRVLDE